jgi:hypothetical protein
MIYIYVVKYNDFPLKEWHIEHMKKTIVKFITGLSDNPTKWETRQNKKYNNIYFVQKGLAHDIKHGVSNSEIQMFLQKIDSDSSFMDLRNKEGFRKRFLEIEDFMIKCK